MSEFGNAFDFPELEDSDLDIAAIFGDPVPAVAAPPPAAGAVDMPESTRDTAPAAEQAAQKKPDAAQNMKQETSDREKANADEDDEDSESDLFAALASKGEPAFKPTKSTQDTPRQVSLFDMPYRELLNHLKDKDPSYYYTDVLVPSGKTLKDFIE